MVDGAAQPYPPPLLAAFSTGIFHSGLPLARVRALSCPWLETMYRFSLAMAIPAQPKDCAVVPTHPVVLSAVTNRASPRLAISVIFLIFNSSFPYTLTKSACPAPGHSHPHGMGGSARYVLSPSRCLPKGQNVKWLHRCTVSRSACSGSWRA